MKIYKGILVFGFSFLGLGLFMGMILFASSCTTDDSSTMKGRMKIYENMAPPIIVVGKSERIEPQIIKNGSSTKTIEGAYGTIILQDSTGTSVAFRDIDMYGNALHASYEKGDTILTLLKY